MPGLIWQRPFRNQQGGEILPEAFEVLKPGIFTTVQDGGFTGYRAFGIPTGGAIDRFSLRAANILTGNDEYTAALEITVKGPTLRVLKDTAIAVTGGNLTPMVNGEPLPMWETVFVREGDIIAFGVRQSGCRSYLAAAGGFDVPPVLGARSVNTRIGIGGTDGRPLRQGDLLKTQPACLCNETTLELLPANRPVYEPNVNLQLLPGPHFRLFNERSVNDFTGAIFNVSEQADRMGVILKGHRIKGPAGERISQPVTPGSVQIPPGGDPILLLADCQTTGGYAHIGTVITADQYRAGQLFPGDKVSFSLVAMEQAINKLLQQEKIITCIRPKKSIRRLCRTAKNTYEIIIEHKNCLDREDNL
jgi:antagonist of KipI